jgi:ABC-type hemin transport system ATPase subunit
MAKDREADRIDIFTAGKIAAELSSVQNNNDPKLRAVYGAAMTALGLYHVSSARPGG